MQIHLSHWYELQRSPPLYDEYKRMVLARVDAGETRERAEQEVWNVLIDRGLVKRSKHELPEES